MPAGDLKDKNLALVGFGTEGRSTAEFLIRAGARLTIFESRPEEEFPAEIVAALRERGAKFHFGRMGPFEGFDALVRSPGISPRLPELAAAAGQGVPFTSATKIFFDLCPCLIVGVTGTKGKGTTSSLIHQILLAAGQDAHLGGNIGTPALEFLDRLTPDSVVVYELSSFQLMELEKSPQIAVVLMATSDHLDFHATTEEYVAAKANIVRFQNRDDQAVINIDYPSSRAMEALTPAEIFEISRKTAVKQGAFVEKNAIMVALGGESRKIMDVPDVPLAGPHNLENVCAAVLVGALLGVPDEAMVPAVRAFRSLPHRLEFVGEAGGVKYYDDSISTTPESAIAALRSFEDPKVLILGGSGKGADWSGLAAEIGSDPALQAVVGLGEEWPRIKAALQVGDLRPELSLIEDAQNMAEAVRAAAAVAPKGGVVILSPACASFGMFRDYKDRGEQFAAAVKALPGWRENEV